MGPFDAWAPRHRPIMHAPSRIRLPIAPIEHPCLIPHLDPLKATQVVPAEQASQSAVAVQRAAMAAARRPMLAPLAAPLLARRPVPVFRKPRLRRKRSGRIWRSRRARERRGSEGEESLPGSGLVLPPICHAHLSPGLPDVYLRRCWTSEGDRGHRTCWGRGVGRSGGLEVARGRVCRSGMRRGRPSRNARTEGGPQGPARRSVAYRGLAASSQLLA